MLIPYKAIERIRDFFAAQIKGLRSPNINAQIIQQQNFLRYKDLYSFLVRYHAQLAVDIGQAYINTMRWYYLSHFTRYRQALEKIALYAVDKQDALGADQTTQRSMIFNLHSTHLHQEILTPSRSPRSESLSIIS